ncbi:hypothetical protein F5I97DRAFT_1138304 [Phlebopus sp. FC_14]|nr:hypothetical protein F5I97DRAFT_1138304 [Phlebopus sp. FC_14]
MFPTVRKLELDLDRAENWRQTHLFSASLRMLVLTPAYPMLLFATYSEPWVETVFHKLYCDAPMLQELHLCETWLIPAIEPLSLAHLRVISVEFHDREFINGFCKLLSRCPVTELAMTYHYDAFPFELDPAPPAFPVLEKLTINNSPCIVGSTLKHISPTRLCSLIVRTDMYGFHPTELYVYFLRVLLATSHANTLRWLEVRFPPPNTHLYNTSAFKAVYGCTCSIGGNWVAE